MSTSVITLEFTQLAIWVPVAKLALPFKDAFVFADIVFAVPPL